MARQTAIIQPESFLPAAGVAGGSPRSPPAPAPPAPARAAPARAAPARAAPAWAAPARPGGPQAGNGPQI
jgi:2-oxoglutarate decarboxylase